jgi:hypothetical protein
MSKRIAVVIVVAVVISAGLAVYLEHPGKSLPFSEAEAGKPLAEAEVDKQLPKCTPVPETLQQCHLPN